MPAPNDSAERLTLLHLDIEGLLQCAQQIYWYLATERPDWEQVHRTFVSYGKIRERIVNCWSLLARFNAARAVIRGEAVEWAGRGWCSWHSAITEALVATYYPATDIHDLRCRVWLGAVGDSWEECHAQLHDPDSLDWRIDPIRCPEGQCLDRATAWHRLRVAARIVPHDQTTVNAVLMLGMSGWAYLTHVQSTLLLSHLRAECEAVQLLKPPAAEPSDLTIWSHGEQSYSVDQKTPIRVTSEEDNILTVFAEQTTPVALDTEGLAHASGVRNVARVIGSLKARYSGQFAPAVIDPGGKKSNGGYFIRVRTLKCNS